ncbi:unnamed protein product [Amoebophrya sp. A25]|nr:unnamed protein product [Amoebophrya sp. A25]|eukprot:GSA25T00013486001.1
MDLSALLVDDVGKNSGVAFYTILNSHNILCIVSLQNHRKTKMPASTVSAASRRDGNKTKEKKNEVSKVLRALLREVRKGSASLEFWRRKEPLLRQQESELLVKEKEVSKRTRVHQKEHTNLLTEIAQKDGQLATLEGLRSKLQADLDDIVTQYERAAEQANIQRQKVNADVQARLASVKEHIRKQTEQKIEDKVASEDLKRQFREAATTYEHPGSEQIDALSEERIKRLDGEMQAFSEELKECKIRRIFSERRGEELEKLIEALSQQEQDFASRTKAFRDTTAKSKAALQKYRREVAQLRRENQQAETGIKKLRREIGGDAAFDSLIADVENLERSLGLLSSSAAAEAASKAQLGDVAERDTTTLGVEGAICDASGGAGTIEPDDSGSSTIVVSASGAAEGEVVSTMKGEDGGQATGEDPATDASAGADATGCDDKRNFSPSSTGLKSPARVTSQARGADPLQKEQDQRTIPLHEGSTQISGSTVAASSSTSPIHASDRTP